MPEIKQCVDSKNNGCNKILPLCNFTFNKLRNKYVNLCKDCKNIHSRMRHFENKEKINKKKRENYYSLNKEEICKRTAEYKKINKDIVRERNRIYANLKRKTDPLFKLRSRVSSEVFVMLKSNKSSKNGRSILDFLPFSIDELKNHLQTQFESWMTWENWGKYNVKTWKDDDPLTWVWSIDHIIPQSSFPFSSMEEDNFQKIWSLDNLRPLSAKQNLLDGVNRNRHIVGSDAKN